MSETRLLNTSNMKQIVLTTLFSLMLSTTLQAAPVLQLCIDEKCHRLQAVKISHATWKNVTDLYTSPVQTDIDEQDNLSSSISLIEHEIYSQIAESSPEHSTAQDAYTQNSPLTNYKNIKRIIALLMDHHLVSRHVLRNTQYQRAWHGQKTIRGLLLQSVDSAELFLLSKDVSQLDATVAIIPYKEASKKLRLESSTSRSLNSFNDEEDSFE